MKKVTAIVPAYNCEDSITRVVSGLVDMVDEILVIDDGSTDRTGELAAAAGAEVLAHAVNRGLGAALRTGFARALEHGSDFIVTLDADGQHAVSDLGAVLERLRWNHCDMVVGSRLVDASQWRSFPPLRLAGNLVLSLLTNLAVGRKVTTDSQSGYRAFTRECVAALDLAEDRMAISSEIVIEAAAKGFRIVDVPIAAHYEDEISTQRFFIDPPAIAWLALRRWWSRAVGRGAPATNRASRSMPEVGFGAPATGHVDAEDRAAV